MLTPTERSWTHVTIYEGDDYLRFQELSEAFRVEADKSEVKRLGDDNLVTEAAKALDDFKTEAAGRGQVVKVQAPPKWKMRELALAHPPREGNLADAKRGYNCDTHPDDFVPVALPLDGQFEHEQARADWVKELSEGNFLRLLNAALRVSDERGVVDPLVSISSRLERTSAESSGPPAQRD